MQINRYSLLLLLFFSGCLFAQGVVDDEPVTRVGNSEEDRGNVDGNPGGYWGWAKDSLLGVAQIVPQGYQSRILINRFEGYDFGIVARLSDTTTSGSLDKPQLDLIMGSVIGRGCKYGDMDDFLAATKPRGDDDKHVFRAWADSLNGREIFLFMVNSRMQDNTYRVQMRAWFCEEGMSWELQCRQGGILPLTLPEREKFLTGFVRNYLMLLPEKQ